MTLESLWNTRKLTDEPYNWLTKTAAPPWIIHLARHSYEYAVLEKASVEEDIEAFAAFIAQLVMIAWQVRHCPRFLRTRWFLRLRFQ